MADKFWDNLHSINNKEALNWLVLQHNLQRLGKPLADAVWYSAVPHWFDHEFLAAIFTKQDAPGDQSMDFFEELVHLSYVEEFPHRGYNIHENSRTLLLKRLWQDNPGLYREIAAGAADYCSRKSAENDYWIIEMVYHLLIADPSAGMYKLREHFWKWREPPHFDYYKAEILTRAAMEHLNAGRIPDRKAAGQILFCEALRCFNLSTFHKAEELLLRIDVTEEEDITLLASKNKILGDINYELNQWDKAYRYYNVCLPMYRKVNDLVGESRCVCSMANLAHKRGAYQDAFDICREAMDTVKKANDKIGEVNLFCIAGEALSALARYEDALDYFERGIRLAEELNYMEGKAYCLKGKGQVFSTRGEYARALESIQAAWEYFHARKNYNNEMECLLAMGFSRYKLKNYKQALDSYTGAVQLSETFEYLHVKSADISQILIIIKDFPVLENPGIRQQLNALTAMISKLT